MKPFIRRIAIAVLLVGSIGIANVASAQPNAGRPGRPDRPAGTARQGQGQGGGRFYQQLNDVITSLNLTDDQSKEVRQIMRESRDSMRDKMQDAQNMDPKDRAALFTDALDEMQTNISAVLKDDQKKTFEDKMGDVRTQMTANFRNAAAPTTAPTTEPAAVAPRGGGFGGGGAGGGMAARLQTALAAADLTDDQKKQVDPIIADAQAKVRDVIAEARNGGNTDRGAMRDKIMAITTDAREKVLAILTPEQKEKVRAAVQNAGGRAGGGDRPNAGTPTTKPADKSTDMPTTQPAARASDPPTSTAPPADGVNNSKTNEAGHAGLAASHDSIALAIGDAMPAIALVKLDGKPVNNKSLANKPTVILFGSYTAASFRDRIPQLKQLAKRYPSSRVNWLVVYTREMHPSDAGEEPERNRDDKIHVDAHKRIEDRTAAARAAKDALEIPFDIVAEPMDDSLSKAFAGFPNAAFVFDAAGKLVAEQQWADPFAIERGLEKATKK